MGVVTLYRSGTTPDDERTYLERDPTAVSLLGEVPPDSTVLARYSVLPFYQDVERELALNGSRLLNSWSEHRFVAGFWGWYHLLEDQTFPSYPMSAMSVLPEGMYVVKGSTNSRKWLWSTHMVATTKAEVATVVGRLMDDTLISQQEIVIREYVPLRAYPIGDVVGPPASYEYRFFVLYGKIVCGGFYWACHVDAVTDAGFEPRDVPNAAWGLAAIAAERVGDRVPFVVIDVAQTQDGRWVVVELNDGQMSGLSCVEPAEFYGSMTRALKGRTG